MAKRRFAFAAAVNNDDVFQRCLLASPDVRQQNGAKAYRGFSNASLAYNHALNECAADVLILAHQDVYFPGGFLERLNEQLDKVEEVDQAWGAVGLIGIGSDGTVGGEVWSSGIGRIVGNPLRQPMLVDSLDEMVLILRTANRLRFDTGLEGFHLYGLDIVQEARSLGQSAWVVPVNAVHHSKPLLTLDRSYRNAWMYLRRKWRDRLPIRGLICDIRAWTIKPWYKAAKMRWKSRNFSKRIEPQCSPEAIAQELGWE